MMDELVRLCVCRLSPFTAKPPFVTAERRVVEREGEGEGEGDGGRVREREEGEEMERGLQEMG